MKLRIRDNVHFILLEKNDTNGKPGSWRVGEEPQGERLGMLDCNSHTHGV